MLLLSATKTDSGVVSFKAGEIELNGVTVEYAREVISDYYTEQINNGELKIEINGIPFSIPYQDIDVNVDIDKTIENIKIECLKMDLKTIFRIN